MRTHGWRGAILAVLASTACSDTRGTSAFAATVDGEAVVGTAEVMILDATPEYELGPRTELNVGAWFARSEAEAADTDVVTLRIYQESDFRAEILNRGSIKGTVQNQRERYDGEPARVYVLENRGGRTFWSTTGEYFVDFARPGRVSGRFSAHMTHVYDELPAFDREVTFDGPVDLRCFRNTSGDSVSQSHDHEFSSDFCSPFREYDGVP